jgi:hypothetical protein
VTVDATAQVEALARASATALGDLPFPQELVVNTGQTGRLALLAGIEAAKTLIAGGDPAQHIRDVGT